jgi:hypothetical protein
LSAVLLALLLLFVGGALGAPAPILRGDSDSDGEVLITDPIFLLNFLFLGGSPPRCDPVADADDDGEVIITDAIYILTFLFIGGAAPPALSEDEVSACAANEAPVLPPRPVYRAYAGAPVEFPIGASDPEGDSILYEALDFPAGAELDPETGMLHWTPAPDQLGPFYLEFAASDTWDPPASTAGILIFQVEVADACAELSCDPAAGCQAVLRPLGQICCGGEPQTRVSEPSAGCPGGRVAYLGRNMFGFGRIRNCDRLRLAALGQGGVQANLNFEARCLNITQPVGLRARLETADELLFDLTAQRTLVPKAGGFAERRGVAFPTEPLADIFGLEGKEANLTAWLTDRDGVVLEVKVRVVLTLDHLPDLPETP